MKTFTVPKNSPQIRLDQWLKEIFPDLGLRAIRRLIATKQILVNSTPTNPAYKVKPNDLINYNPCPTPKVAPPVIIQETDSYIFFQKPANIHTVSLQGGQNPSLEEAINSLPQFQTNKPILLQRLDYETSGLICAAKTPYAALKFREAERSGLITKKYLAILHGQLKLPTIATQILDPTHKLVRQESGQAHPLRHTSFEPLAFFLANSPWPNWFINPKDYPLVPLDLTLTGCILKMGVRHQIRSHAKSLNHPLWLDDQYTLPNFPKPTNQGTFYLHQIQITLPETSCTLWPDWLTNVDQLPKIREWLEN